MLAGEPELFNLVKKSSCWDLLGKWVPQAMGSSDSADQLAGMRQPNGGVVIKSRPDLEKALAACSRTPVSEIVLRLDEAYIPGFFHDIDVSELPPVNCEYVKNATGMFAKA